MTSDSKTVDISHSISFDDDGPAFIKTFWDFDGDAPFPGINNTGEIDEDSLPGGIANGPGDGPGDAHVDGTVFFDFGADQPGHIAIQALTVKDANGATLLNLSIDSGGNLVGANNLKTVDNQAILIERTGPDGAGVVAWNAYVDLGGGTKGDPVFTFSVDGSGANIGDFNFDLYKALEHPLTDNPSTGAVETAFEDNLSVDFTVRGYDGDGDSADGHVKITIDDDLPKIAGKTEGCLDEACFEKTGECVSIDAKDENVDFSGTGATNGAIIITAIHQPNFSGEEVIKNFDNNGIPGFGIESNGDGGSEDRHLEINYTGDGSPFDTPGEVLSVKLANPDALAACATVELSEFYNGEGGVGAERGQYQLYRDGAPVSGWIAFVGQTPRDATPGSGIVTLSIDGPHEGFDEIRFRAIVGSNDGDGGDSSDFNVKSAKFDLGAVEPVCITGPINGFYGADGPGNIAIINANLPAITVDGVPVVVTVSGDGHTATGAIGGETIFTLTVDPATKTYKFEIFSPIDNDPDGEKLVFGYKITDADGDNLSSTIEILVKDEGKPSVGAEQAAARVDEDGLPAGIGDSAPGDQATDPAHNLPNESYWRGEIVLDGGCDGLQDIALSTTQPTGVKTLDGQDVKTVWDAGTHTLTGYVGADPNNAANKVFTITLDENPDGTPNGSYVLQLLKPVKHADGSQENDVGFNITVTVTDNDGSTATGTLPVNIDDDIPTLCVEVKWDGRVQHDETPGVDNGTDDDDSGGKVPSYFIGIPGAGAIIGWAEDEEGESSVSVDVNYGADGKGSLNYELDIPGAGTPSGVQTTDGKDIFLFEEGNVVVGRVGNGGPDAAGAVAFAVHVDGDDGDLQVAQFLSLKHPDTGSDDETIDLINSALQVKVTATDKDNDPVSQSVNIGDLVRFDDDGPEAKIEKKHGAEIRLDESKDAAAADGPADPNANDEAASGDLTDIAYKTVAGSSLFTVEEDSYGADGAGTKAFSLIVNGANSGLDDTETGKDVILSQSGNVVTGRAGPGAGDPIVFTITIDPTDGDITVAQFRAVKHDNSSDPDEAGPDANDTGTDEPQTMSSNTLLLAFTVTDGDNDKDSSSIDLGKLFRFEDDGVIARDDVDTLDSLGGGLFGASGNVISGASTVSPATGQDDGGTDYFPGGKSGQVSSIQGKAGTDSSADGSGNFVIGGSFGTLTINKDGTYSYDLDEAKIPTIPAGGKDVFTYKLIDNDGDSDTATLTINLPTVASPTVAVNLTNDQLVIKEDTTGSFVVTATAGDATDHITKLTFTKLADLEAAGWTVSVTGFGGTVGVFAAGVFTVTGVVTSAQVQVTLTPPADTDKDVINAVAADITVVSTAEDNATPGLTANSATKVVDVNVDAVLDQFLDVTAGAIGAVSESVATQNVSLNLSSAFSAISIGSPFTDSGKGGVDGDNSEVVSLTAIIKVTSDIVDLSLSGANPGVTLVEGPAGTWTMTADTLAHLQELADPRAGDRAGWLQRQRHRLG